MGTSGQEVGRLRMVEHTSLPKQVRCEYNEREPCCPYLWLYVSCQKEEIPLVLYVFLAIKQCACLCFHALQARVLRWIKPPTTSLLLGTLADLARGKSELIAENALLRQQLIILSRQVKPPACKKTDRILLVLLARGVRAWKQTLLIIQPETLLRWHRELFRRYWKRRSKASS